MLYIYTYILIFNRNECIIWRSNTCALGLNCLCLKNGKPDSRLWIPTQAGSTLRKIVKTKKRGETTILIFNFYFVFDTLI